MKRSNKAFTLVELLVVIGILGILTAVLVGTLGGSTESALAAKCEANLHNLAMAATSYAMNDTDGNLPRAASTADGDNLKPGWISYGTDSANGSYISPYEKDDERRLFSLTNGLIWASIKGSRESYVCPTHQRYAKDKRLGDPLWSYQMSTCVSGKAFKSITRANRHLLFAEIPYKDAKTPDGQVFQNQAKDEDKLDPVLDYNEDEVIGFNHQDKKNCYAHVCFVDGHVEKLLAPRGFSESKARELTEWLCQPYDDKGDFDISFDGKEYKKY